MKHLRDNIFLKHLVYWVAIYSVTFLSVFAYESLRMGFEIATLLILPAPLPVYLHFFVLKKFFIKRKYILYILSTSIIIFVAGIFSEYTFNLFFGGPGSHTSGFLMVLFYIITSTALKYSAEGIKNRYAFQEIEFKQLQTELSLLKSQINPHFFFNTLNNLYALSLAKSDEVPSVILKLSDLMRYVLETSKKKFVGLESEIEFLKNYIELEKLRLENNCAITFNVSGDISNFNIAPMLLVPFVENCFKHGIGASREKECIIINAKLSGNQFTFSCENSKPGNGMANNENSHGMGLTNVKRRLELIYPVKHELDIISDMDSFKIKLSLTG